MNRAKFAEVVASVFSECYCTNGCLYDAEATDRKVLVAYNYNTGNFSAVVGRDIRANEVLADEIADDYIGSFDATDKLGTFNSVVDYIMGYVYNDRWNYIRNCIVDDILDGKNEMLSSFQFVEDVDRDKLYLFVFAPSGDALDVVMGLENSEPGSGENAMKILTLGNPLYIVHTLEEYYYNNRALTDVEEMYTDMMNEPRRFKVIADKDGIRKSETSFAGMNYFYPMGDISQLSAYIYENWCDSRIGVNGKTDENAAVHEIAIWLQSLDNTGFVLNDLHDRWNSYYYDAASYES